MNLGLGITNNTCYYLENKYGVDLVKKLIVVVFADMKAMLLWNVLSLEIMYGMRQSTISIYECRLIRIQKMNTTYWPFYKTLYK
jgi:hypothetical protein